MSDILVYGDPILTQKAEKVKVFNEELTRFIAEMHKAMIKAHGVGLAAPQIGVGKQIAIVDLSVGENPDELRILINPEIIATEGIQKGDEGCLSFPDIVTIIDRPQMIKIQTHNLAGDLLVLEGEGLLARAFCHEIDHLNGVLILDRVSPLKRDLIKKKVQKRVKAGTWTS